MAIISFGGVVSCNSVRIGGDKLDDAIIQYVRKQYNVLIGERTAEQIKMEIGYTPIEHEELTMEVRGRDLVNGLPKTLELASTEIQAALHENMIHFARQGFAISSLNLLDNCSTLSCDICPVMDPLLLFANT